MYLYVMMMMKMIIRFCKGKIVVWGDYVSAGKVAVAAHWLPPFLRLDWLSKIPNTLKFSGHSFLTIMMMRTKCGLHAYIHCYMVAAYWLPPFSVLSWLIVMIWRSLLCNIWGTIEEWWSQNFDFGTWRTIFGSKVTLFQSQGGRGLGENKRIRRTKIMRRR